MAGISDKALKSQYAENKYKFNEGNELQSKEFSDGSGLEAYDANFRMYDPQIGRFWQLDPLADINEDWSPYTFASDNPILFNDPLGLDDSVASLPAPGKVPVQPPKCLTCQLPKPDVSGTAGPAPDSHPLPINDWHSTLWHLWNDHNVVTDIAYELNNFNPLAQAVNWGWTKNTGHDSYGVEQSTTRATTRLLASVPISTFGSLLSVGEEILANGIILNEEINITENGFMHVMQRHYPRSGMFLTKSKFSISAREIVNLIKNSSQLPKILQRGGNYIRIVNAGRVIGVDAITGQPTSVFTIVTNKAGDLVTSFPGLPGR